MALPQGFVLDAPPAQPKLPQGFVLDNQAMPSAVPQRNETIGNALPTLSPYPSVDTLTQDPTWRQHPYLAAIQTTLQQLGTAPRPIVEANPTGYGEGLLKRIGEQATPFNLATLTGGGMVAKEGLAVGSPLVKKVIQAGIAALTAQGGANLLSQAKEAQTNPATTLPEAGARTGDALLNAFQAAPMVVAGRLGQTMAKPTPSGLTPNDVNANVYAGLLRQPSRFVGDEHGTVSDQYPPTKPQKFSAEDLQSAMSKNQIVPKADMTQDPAILQAIKDAGYDLSSRSPTTKAPVTSPVVDATKKSGVITPQAELPLQEKPTATSKYNELVASLKGKTLDEVQPVMKQIEELKNESSGAVPKEVVVKPKLDIGSLNSLSGMYGADSPQVQHYMKTGNLSESLLVKKNEETSLRQQGEVAKEPTKSSIAPQQEGVTETVEPPLRTEVTLPSNLGGAKPRYGYGDKLFELQFKNDTDKALYIAAQSVKSKSDNLYRKWLAQNGWHDSKIDQWGLKVKARIKELAKNEVDTSKPLVIPSQSFEPWAAVKLAIDPTKQKLHSGLDPEIFDKVVNKTIKNANEIALTVGNKLKNVKSSQELKTTMAAMKDATSGLATKHANEGASSVTGQLERDTGRKDKRNSLDRQALLFVRESRETPATLQAWKQQLLKSPASKERAQALLALNHAITDFDKLAPTSKIYDSLMEKEVKLEEQSGRAIERLKDVGYVMHLAEDEGDKTSFTHARDPEMQTMVDRISKGVPLGSLDAVELLRSRIARGQQIYVQAKVFRDNLERLKTPDGQQVVKPLEKVSRGEGRKEDVRVPSGYRKVSIGQEDIAVHEGYSDTVQALVDPSVFLKNSIGRTVMNIRGVGKSFALAGDSFHVVRVGAYGVGAKLGTGNAPMLRYKTGVTVLDNSIGELMKKAESGQIDKADLPNLVEWKRRLDMGIKTGFNVSRVVDAFNQHWVEKIPGLKESQRWIFQTWQRGVMADVYNKTWEVYRKQNPQMTEMQVSRKVSADLNEVFGTLGRQSWLAKSRTFQDMWQLIALAPQWTEGRARTELHAYTGTAEGVGRMLQGKAPNFNIQSRVVGSIILMYLAANQVINMTTRKQVTFSNKENDHKLDAFIPDKMGGSEGYWLSPIANAEEVTHSLINSYQKQGGNVWEAWLDFAGGHESTLAKPLLTGMTGRAYGLTGPSVPRFTGMMENALPVPIGTPALKEIATGKTSQQTEKQVLSRVGLKVDNAQSARQQIYQKVRQWKQQNNIPEETGLFPQSKYLGLIAALRKNDVAEAQKEYRSLQEPDGKNTTEQKVKLIKEYFKDYASKSFTGRKDLEDKFVSTLSADDKALYEKAKTDNNEVEQRFFDMIGEPIPHGRKKGKKRSLIFE